MIRSYSFDEYVELVRSFHSHAAPGVLIGGFMVDLAYRHLPHDAVVDALCETAKCLPDAIQILTPCTLGNGWLKVVDLGRFALNFYDKQSGEGVRVSVNSSAIEKWPEIRDWFFKLKPKGEQNKEVLVTQIKEAQASYCDVRYVKVVEEIRRKKHRSGFAVCPRCKEAYPLADGEICLGCQGDSLWEVMEAPMP
jgi:formylmethanofuran dehydrogenase subunit E